MSWSPCVFALGVDGLPSRLRDLPTERDTVRLLLVGGEAVHDPEVLSLARMARHRGVLTVALVGEALGGPIDEPLESFDTTIVTPPASVLPVAASLADMVRAGDGGVADVARLARVLGRGRLAASATRQGFGEKRLWVTFDQALHRLAERLGPQQVGARRLVVNVTGGNLLGPADVARSMPALHACFPEVQCLTMGYVRDPLLGGTHRVTLVAPHPRAVEALTARASLPMSGRVSRVEADMPYAPRAILRVARGRGTAIRSAPSVLSFPTTRTTHTPLEA